MSEKVTLSDLSNGAVPTNATPVGMPKKLDTSNVKDVNVNEVSVVNKPKEIESTGNPMLDKAFEGIDDTINRLQNETNAIYAEGEEKRIEEAIDNDTDSIEDALSNNKTNNAVVVHKFDEEIPSTTENKQPEPVQETKPEKPVTIEKTVNDSAPVAGTEKKNIIMADPSIYDEDEHLFDGIEDDDMKYLDDEEDNSNEDIDDEDEKAITEEIKKNLMMKMNIMT